MEKISDRDTLLVIADDIEGFWAQLATKDLSDAEKQILLEIAGKDAAKLREIANAR